MAQRRGRRSLALVALAAVAAATALGADAAGITDRLEGDTVDARFALRGERPVDDVAVVAVDSKTFDELKQQWPFPRTLHARVVDRLRKAGAREVAYDVQFTEPSENGADDLALYEAVGRAGNAVLATTEVNEKGASRVLGGDDVLAEAGARAGHAGVELDAGGVARRMPHSVARLETFAVAAAEQATRRPVAPSSFPEDGAYIDYHGPPGTVPTLSFSQVLRGRFDPALVRGRVVVVGASAPSLQDVHSTSTGELMPGPELQANAISTVLRGLPLRTAPAWIGALAVLLFAAAGPLAAARLAVARAALVLALLLALWLALCWAAFHAGLVLPVLAPSLSLGLAGLGGLALRLGREARERRRTRELLGRFAPGSVVDELLAAPGGGRSLPGTRCQATVLFCDLRGFSSFAEHQPAEHVLEVLNRYLAEMSEALLEHEGTVVSYMGDGIMAVFGSPIERPDHAIQALAASREMIGLRLERFNAWLAAQGHEPLRMGIGLNSGAVMSGTVGSAQRIEYAAVGDTTNVAARIEAMTKQRGGGLLLSGSTYALLDDTGRELEPAGEVEVRGRAAAVELWTLPGASVERLQAA